MDGRITEQLVRYGLTGLRFFRTTQGQRRRGLSIIDLDDHLLRVNQSQGGAWH